MKLNEADSERATGLEPATSSLGSWHSTTELRPRIGLKCEGVWGWGQGRERRDLRILFRRRCLEKAAEIRLADGGLARRDVV
jgi:hypothetical protein